MNDKRSNSAIRSNKVMVISSNGQQLGILPKHIAISKAENQGYDLVEVSAKSNPPVCRIMDYGKYKFEQNKLDRKNKSRNKVHLKEVRMKTVIANHDLTTKMKKCVEFLQKGDKVKISIQLHPRRRDTKKAYELMDTITDVLSDIAKIDKKPTAEGRYINSFFIHL